MTDDLTDEEKMELVYIIHRYQDNIAVSMSSNYKQFKEELELTDRLIGKISRTIEILK